MLSHHIKNARGLLRLSKQGFAKSKVKIDINKKEIAKKNNEAKSEYDLKMSKLRKQFVRTSDKGRESYQVQKEAYKQKRLDKEYLMYPKKIKKRKSVSFFDDDVYPQVYAEKKVKVLWDTTLVNSPTENYDRDEERKKAQEKLDKQAEEVLRLEKMKMLDDQRKTTESNSDKDLKKTIKFMRKQIHNDLKTRALHRYLKEDSRRWITFECFKNEEDVRQRIRQKLRSVLPLKQLFN